VPQSDIDFITRAILDNCTGWFTAWDVYQMCDGQDSMPEDHISRILEDLAGGLWLSTMEDNSGRHFMNLHLQEKTPGAVMWSPKMMKQ